MIGVGVTAAGSRLARDMIGGERQRGCVGIDDAILAGGPARWLNGGV